MRILSGAPYCRSLTKALKDPAKRFNGFGILPMMSTHEKFAGLATNEPTLWLPLTESVHLPYRHFAMPA